MAMDPPDGRVQRESLVSLVILVFQVKVGYREPVEVLARKETRVEGGIQAFQGNQVEPEK